ncbi:MAG TPA: sugar ABC transporter substrate-binding protein [Baekduia sp.]|uniref:ABC transporter substrate-binding protein n=1 Tax=Baekduia sp. TaxID=2600305 RepID=UPI002D79223C|nr:sugar ABC transporter substrate-binding protein [Baekduia sp.]HET6508603.1 sugar ABC transporter substrate-binding protein [Baekduia sp.]
MRSTKWVSVIAAGALTFGVAACGSDDNNNSGSSGSGSSTAAGGDSGGKSGKIALLLPESKTARYESQDRPSFEAKMKELCPSCQVIYSNADQDASKQQQQAEAALTQGAKVLVLDPVDSASAAAIVTRAQQSKVPVISYDRLILNSKPDYYISFDNVQVGKLQAQSLVDKLKSDGSSDGKIVMINGAPTDNNAKLFKQGAHSVIDGSGLKVAKEYDTPDWSPDKAQSEMEQAITALGKNGFVGVYSANDGNAGGIVAAMKSNGVDPKKIPITGQDAELAGIQRIVAGTQYMTVYKAIKPEAEAAATLANDLLNGKQPEAGLVNDKTNNGQADIPSVLLKPVAVTKDNINDTIVKDGFWTADQICTSQYAAACKSAGIQ